MSTSIGSCLWRARWQHRHRLQISGGCRSNSTVSGRRKHRTRCSTMFLPRAQPDSHQATVSSHKLLLEAGLIRQSSSGIYHLLPLGLRVLERLVTLVDHHMQAIGGSKIALPILTPAALWRTSGRWESVGSELFRLKGSTGVEYCLGPTHEESVTELVGSELSSHRQLPLRLYQLDRKFRDEMRPRGGLLRCKEFWMKDMYTFDVSEEAASETYQEVCGAYEQIFKALSLPVVKVNAATGNIGGSLSHEYHVMSPVGEDTLILCQSCGRGYNRELLNTEGGDLRETTHLPECTHREECQLEQVKGIEIAHTFYLGTKYSSLFEASFSDNTNTERLCEMGCYGVGISRLLQTTLEHSCSSSTSSHSNEGGSISWPLSIAPFTVCVLPLTTSTDLGDSLMLKAHHIYDRLSDEGACPGHVILDDRTQLSMGARLRDSRRLGYPCTIVVGHKTREEEYEVRIQRNGGEEETSFQREDQVLQTVREIYKRSHARHS